MSRCSDLENHIRTCYRIIPEYEGIIQMSGDPKEKARARREIQVQWTLIEGYLEELRQIGERPLARDVAEVAAHFPQDPEWWEPALVLVPEEDLPEKHRGLIVIVGTGRPGEDPFAQSAWKAIEYHLSDDAGLAYCWLIATTGTTGSLPTAQVLRERCQEKGVVARVCPVNDPFGVQESYKVVLQIYTQYVPKVGLSEREVIADFTGGTKPMSVGMVLACGDRRSMQYMYGRKRGVASIPRLIEFVSTEE
jgi:hypothetical protein